MYFSTLRFSTLFLFTFLTLSYALPTVDHGPISELVERAKSKPKSNPKQKTKASGKHDGQVSTNYKPKIRTRDEDILAILQARSADGDSIKVFDARDDHYSSDETLSGARVHKRSFNDALSVTGTALEARKGGGGLGEAIADVITGIVDIIKSKVKQDNDVRTVPHLSWFHISPKLYQAREKFTQETVANGREKFPHFNWAICHVKHKISFWGEKGKDWGHQHSEFDIKIGGTIG